MANDISCNPLVLDTAAATAVISSYIVITSIRWVDYNNDIADADQCVLQNAAGKLLWEARATIVGAGTTFIPGDSTDFALPLKAKGLIVPTLTHGRLYIYFDIAKGQPVA